MRDYVLAITIITLISLSTCSVLIRKEIEVTNRKAIEKGFVNCTDLDGFRDFNPPERCKRYDKAKGDSK